MFAGAVFAQADKTVIDAFKKEAVPLQIEVEEAVNSVVPGLSGVVGRPQATYLEGYGVVVSLEVSLAPTRTPFSSPKTPAEVRTIVKQRQKLVEEKLGSVLKDLVAKEQFLTEADSLTIALHLFNSNPVDLPTLPSQLVLTVKKQDPATVIVREF